MLPTHTYTSNIYWQYVSTARACTVCLKGPEIICVRIHAHICLVVDFFKRTSVTPTTAVYPARTSSAGVLHKYYYYQVSERISPYNTTKPARTNLDNIRESENTEQRVYFGCACPIGPRGISWRKTGLNFIPGGVCYLACYQVRDIR